MYLSVVKTRTRRLRSNDVSVVHVTYHTTDVSHATYSFMR